MREEALEAEAAATRTRAAAAELQAAEHATAAELARAAAAAAKSEAIEAAAATETAKAETEATKGEIVAVQAAADARRVEDIHREEERRAVMAEEHLTAMEQHVAGAYAGVRSELRALRRRYFKRASASRLEGGNATGSEKVGAKVGDDSSGDEAGDGDRDGEGMGRVERRLDLQGLVSAMLSFKRSSDDESSAAANDGMTPSAAAALAAQREMRLMEECLLLMLAGDLGPAPSPGSGSGDGSATGSVSRGGTAAGSYGLVHQALRSSTDASLRIEEERKPAAETRPVTTQEEEEEEEKKEEINLVESEARVDAAPGNDKIVHQSAAAAAVVTTTSRTGEDDDEGATTEEEDINDRGGGDDDNEEDDDFYVGHRGYGISADHAHLGMDSSIGIAGGRPDDCGDAKHPQVDSPEMAPPPPPPPPGRTHLPRRNPPPLAPHLYPIDEKNSTHVGGTRGQDALSPSAMDRALVALAEGEEGSLEGQRDEAEAQDGMAKGVAGRQSRVVSLGSGGTDDYVDHVKPFSSGTSSVGHSAPGTGEMDLEVCESPREFGTKHVRGALPRRKPPPQPQPQYPAIAGKKSQPYDSSNPSSTTQTRYPERGADHLRNTLGRVSAAENRSKENTTASKKTSQGGSVTSSKKRASSGASSSSTSMSVAKGSNVPSSRGRGGYQKISSVYGRPSQGERERDRERGREAPPLRNQTKKIMDVPVSYGHTEAELGVRGRRRDDMSLLTASDNDVLEMLTEVARGGRR